MEIPHFGHYLANSEWRKNEALSDSPFFDIPDCGRLQVIYQRAWWPSLFRLLVTGIPLSLLGLYLVIDLVTHVHWLQVIAAGWFYIVVNVVFLFIAGAPLIYGALELAHIDLSWPTKTASNVAVFSYGIAWQLDGSVQAWRLNQLKKVQLDSVFMEIETKEGQKQRFHHSLSNFEFGLKARIATGDFPDPETLLVCPNCGEMLDPDFSRCIYCLLPVNVPKAAPRPCPMCGAIPPSEEDMFCRTCGTSLKKPVA